MATSGTLETGTIVSRICVPRTSATMSLSIIQPSAEGRWRRPRTLHRGAATARSEGPIARARAVAADVARRPRPLPRLVHAPAPPRPTARTRLPADLYARTDRQQLPAHAAGQCSALPAPGAAGR